MPVYEIYSRRKKRAEQTEPDVYRYDTVPGSLRAQIQHLWDTAIGPDYEPVGGYGLNVPPPHNNEGWNFIRDSVCREKGLLSLASHKNPRRDCLAYLHGQENIDDVLDLIEFSFKYISLILSKGRDYDRRKLGMTQHPNDAIAELNFRFREAGVGYQFESNQIVRVDSQLVHAEVVRPALQLLSDPRFKGAQEEFLSAHAHYRAREHKDAITDALNAFESTLKTICGLRNWQYAKGARATDLLKVVRANGLLPDYLDNSFDQLAATLASGLPKIRNEEGGHGQGAAPKETPGYIAAYALHLAAANIVLLVDAFKALPR
jgi:hypothetical protein